MGAFKRLRYSVPLAANMNFYFYSNKDSKLNILHRAMAFTSGQLLGFGDLFQGQLGLQNLLCLMAWNIHNLASRLCCLKIVAQIKFLQHFIDFLVNTKKYSVPESRVSSS